MSSPNMTMGTLYWQLNDVWQGPTWSSIEFGGKKASQSLFIKPIPVLLKPLLTHQFLSGKWKALHYVIRRVYNPVLVSALVNKATDEVEIHLTTEIFNQMRVQGTITVQLLSYKDSANPIKTKSLNVDVPASTSQKVIASPLSDILEQTAASNEVFLHIEFTDTEEQYYTYTTLFLSALKHVRLPVAVVTITSVQWGADDKLVVALQANATAALVVVESIGILGYFSDNAFTMLAGRTYLLTFTPSKEAAENLTPEMLKDSLSVRSLVDMYYPEEDAATSTM